jgi:hypothetical protein
MRRFRSLGNRRRTAADQLAVEIGVLRLRRLGNVSSKKAANHAHMMAVYFHALQFRARLVGLDIKCAGSIV